MVGVCHSVVPLSPAKACPVSGLIHSLYGGHVDRVLDHHSRTFAVCRNRRAGRSKPRGLQLIITPDHLSASAGASLLTSSEGQSPQDARQSPKVKSATSQ